MIDILLILDTCRGVSGRNNGLAMSEREYKIRTVHATSEMYYACIDYPLTKLMKSCMPIKRGFP